MIVSKGVGWVLLHFALEGILSNKIVQITFEKYKRSASVQFVYETLLLLLLYYFILGY